VFGIVLAMFGTAALTIALTCWVRVPQPTGAASEAASRFHRRPTSEDGKEQSPRAESPLILIFILILLALPLFYLHRRG